MQGNKNIFTAARVAIRGLFIVAQQRAFRRGLFLLLLLLILHGFVQSAFSIFAIFLCLLILMAECFNTAIEILCNKVCPEYDEQIRNIKDVAAAGVLVSVILLVSFLAFWAHLEIFNVG